jgi:tetratricopeptide (TPR) repeat protein
MRILQARFVGPAMLLAAVMFVRVSPGNAQKGSSTGGGATTPNPGKGTPTPTPGTGTPGSLPSSQSPNTPSTPQPPRPIWITGKVMMYDGGAPPDPATIELVCSTSNGKPQGYTDSHGGFSINLGQNNFMFADASTSTFGDIGEPGGFDQSGFGRNTSTNSSMSGGMNSMNQDSAYWGCDIRARLPGYRSDSLSLAGRRMLDNPDIGAILLYPIAGIQGLIASATSGQAPKDARKALEKGRNDAKKNKPDQAEQEFRKAVQIYPRYAEAWLELGKILEQREHYPEARQAYASALAADSKFVYPYEKLYQIALREQNWKDLAERTDQLLHLDPFEFPAAYYFNALAHLQMKEYDDAEKSAQRAVEADRKQANPKTHFLLGAIQIQKQDWTKAAESFRAYLKAAPNALDKEQVQKTLGQLDQQISRMQPASPTSATQQ